MARYPEPPVKYAGYSDLYFATEEQVRSWGALGNYDRGELTVVPGRLTFRGMRVLVDCPGVRAIRLARKSFPWAVAICVGAAAALLVYLNSPVPFTWRQPLPYFVAGVLLVACARQWGEKWVEVVYADGEGERRAYFRREPVWWGLGAARTRRLQQDLRVTVLGIKPAGPDAAPDGAAQ